VSVQCGFLITEIRYQALSALVPTDAMGPLGLEPDTTGSTSLEDSSSTCQLRANLPVSTSDCILGAISLGQITKGPCCTPDFKSDRPNASSAKISCTNHSAILCFAKDKFKHERVRVKVSGDRNSQVDDVVDRGHTQSSRKVILSSK
jgi:hypothetical protein